MNGKLRSHITTASAVAVSLLLLLIGGCGHDDEEGGTQGAGPPLVVVVNSSSPVTLSLGQTLRLDGTGSGASVGRIVSYAWSASGPGNATFTAPGAATTDVTFDRLGTYKVTLAVTDEDGLTDSVEVEVSVGGTLAWARRAGGASGDEGRGVAVLSDGSALVTGVFISTATLGAGEVNETNLTLAGYAGLFLARYNADGSLAWARRARGRDYDWGMGVAVLSDGSALVTGSFGYTGSPTGGSATFGAGEANETSLTSAGSGDIFLARFNP